MIALVLAVLLTAEPDEHRTEIRPGPATPTPTAVIGKDRLALAPDLADAVDGEPGLRVVHLGGLGAYATLSIRGSTPEQVAVLLDGIPINPADGAPVDLSTLPLGPLDALALYRGRAPYAFGVDAIGGVLALRSRKTRPAAEASVGLGSFDTRVVRGWGATDGFGVALDYSGSAGDFRFLNDRGTAFDTSDDEVVRRANADFDQGSVLVKGALGFDDVIVTLLSLYTASERGLPGLGIDPTVSARYAAMREVAGARVDARVGDAGVGAVAYVGWSSSAVTDPANEIGLGSGDSEITSLVPGATVQATLPITMADWRLTSSLVAAYRHESSDGVVDAHRDLFSAALETSLKHDWFEVEAGLRLELLPDPLPVARAALTARSATTRVSLAAHSSHRLPSLFELYGDTGTTLGRDDLRPESALGVELSARWDPDPSLSLEAYLHATSVDDLIQLVQNAQNVVRPENVASARILGAELAGEYTNDHLYIRGSLTFLDAVDTSDVVARAGKQLPLRPTFATSLRTELRFGDDDARVGIWAELDHSAGNALDFANLVMTEARTLLGAGLFVERPHVRVDVSLANLLDERVVDLAGYPLPGVTALVLVRLDSR